MNVLLSVIIPVYNVELYLERCVKSIISQSCSSLEIILVDDGSTDTSFQICNKLRILDSRIQVIQQENGGVSTARNLGITRAKGEYITFVDSDDWVEPGMYAQMLQIVQYTTNLDVVMCDFYNVKSDVKEKISTNLRSGHYSKEEIFKEIFPTLLVKENFGRIPIVSTCTCIFRRRFMLHHSITFDANLKFSEDYLFMSKVMVAATSFYYLKNSFFYNYRQHNTSRSKKFNDKWWPNLLYLNSESRKLLSNHNYDFSRQLDLQLIHSVLLVINGISEDNKIAPLRKIQEISKIVSEEKVQIALKSNMPFQKLSLRFTLFLIKNKFIAVFLVYRRLLFLIKR